MPIYGRSQALKQSYCMHKSFMFNYLEANKYLHRMVITMHLPLTSETESMLRITNEKKRGKIYLNVEGRLAGPWVAALEQCWRGVRAASAQDKFHVNLCGGSFIDAARKGLLKGKDRQGGGLVAGGRPKSPHPPEVIYGGKQGGR